jgi:toxin ParE1/3/4
MGMIRRTKRAMRDAAEIWHFIAEDNPRAATAQIERFEKTLTLLSDFPGIGTDRSDLAKSLRSFPVGNYLLLYRPLKKGIQLIRIFHGARDLRSLFKK